MTTKDESIMIILSSPSGAGKTTIAKKIQQKYLNFKISVSHTTRKPRPNEVHGIDYFFVSKNEFQKKIENNEFYEYAKIFDNYYGTSKKMVLDLIKNKKNVLFDIDWQGTKKLSKFKELNLIKIFILPPSKKELEKRLTQRNQDRKESVNKRLKSYANDIVHWEDYDYIITNEDLENCFRQIEKIIETSIKPVKLN
ncbi:MAG: guanylate kinase [Candidatus Pelagibacter sp. TMED106]|nr:MAG: guanylate kinase [Candidatus Pelagibacter sp. TMED106]|tara:strand:+ start:1907 stop:2494 length:588 start_codon:yes stop_codon:yes gene_type:complete